MAELHEIDGLLILGATLVAVTAFSALRGLYARSLASRRPKQEVVAIAIHANQHRAVTTSSGSRRKAA